VSSDIGKAGLPVSGASGKGNRAWWHIAVFLLKDSTTAGN